MPVLKVGYVLPWTTVGGGEIATVRLARALADNDTVDESGLRIHAQAYVAAGGTGEVVDLCARAGCPVRPYVPAEFSYRHPIPFIEATFRLARQFRRDGIGLVHCSDLTGVYHAGFAGRLANIPVVTHIRSQFPDRLSRRRKWPISTASHFLFVSQATWQHFDGIWRVPPSRGTVVYDWPPGAAAGGPGEARTCQEIRAELGIPGDAPVVTMVARVSPQKDFDTLFEAFAIVRRRHPRVHLVLVGGSDPTEEGQRLARRWRSRTACEFPGQVSWTGARADVHDLLLASDIAVLVSHGEGLPLVLLEAMASGRPVVATDVGGVPELVVDGRTGLLHRPHDSRGLAIALNRLIEDRMLADALGAAGRDWVASRFSKQGALQSVRQVYATMTGSVTPHSGHVAVAVP